MRSGIAKGLNKGHITTPNPRPVRPSTTKGVPASNAGPVQTHAVRPLACPRSHRLRALREESHGAAQEQQGQARPQTREKATGDAQESKEKD